MSRLCTESNSCPAGMGVSTVTAARILKGQLQHGQGEESLLEMDKFPFVALAKVSPPGQGHGREASNEPKLGQGRAEGAGSGARWPCQGAAVGTGKGGTGGARRLRDATGPPRASPGVVLLNETFLNNN